MTPTYEQFLHSKIKLAKSVGLPFASSDIHPMLFPHQRDSVRWAVEGGRRKRWQAALAAVNETLARLKNQLYIVEELSP